MKGEKAGKNGRSSSTVSGNKAHVPAVAVPAQGHLKPLMSRCQQIVKHGIKATLVNAQSIHDKIVSSVKMPLDDSIFLTSIPDGLTPNDDPNRPFVLLDTLKRTMQQTLPDMIDRINTSNPNERISCIFVDFLFGWVFDIAEKMGAEPVGFVQPSIATFAMITHIPNLIQKGYLDTNGSLEKIDLVSLSDEVPSNRKDEIPWSFPSDLKTQKMFFEYSCEEACKRRRSPRNVVQTQTTFTLKTNIWLDTKSAGLVLYVSFGSIVFHAQQQPDELALKLELSDQPFLWVMRWDFANGSRGVFPDGILERVSEFGENVEWAPHKKVLSHPAITCFMSHIALWVELDSGRGNYICDKWEIGLRIDRNKNGMRSRDEIKNKIDMLLSDSKFKENAIKLKEMCAKSIGEGGSLYNNLMTFIDHPRK
ncbi:hypothetical protein OROMI_018685 [Orobanche minor]